MTTPTDESPIAMVPGPIEFDPEVLAAMSHSSQSHVAAPFIHTFQETLSLLRQLFFSTNPADQGFVISGSGTLGWDLVAANLIDASLESTKQALVINTGFFSDSFATCLGVYGAKVTNLAPPAVGSYPSLESIESALKQTHYQVVTITHVDTSTGVLQNVQEIASLIHRVSPCSFIIVDGVCSIGVENLQFSDWHIDFALTAPQKAIGAPSGLSIAFASARVLEYVEVTRKSPVPAFYADLKKWSSIMKAMEAGKPAYFATPAVQNIHSLNVALHQIVSAGPGAILDRFTKHAEASNKIKDFVINDLGLQIVALDRDHAANGMTAIYLPEGITNAQLLPAMAAQGVVLAGGIHKEIATKYFRIGHMGVSVVDKSRVDVDYTLKTLKQVIKDLSKN
ncbi:aminotransferase [Nadsonia fulvescens var. elongata DSM 6958]|uniref:alanine--glyoxylate transaminase n=1 Tax=Nadsonia fulvescens var. elongata DSM 6958 TaxID=857566 RepID=A0A1E3PQZ9_9ASCO|nr:aminotransferase [Nadsonia fulvescens var. elongata DSM 6958]